MVNGQIHDAERCVLAAHGTVSAVGRGSAEVRRCLREQELPEFQVLGDVLPSREVLFGAVRGDLPNIPEHL